jgi:hypothetical protein
MRSVAMKHVMSFERKGWSCVRSCAQIWSRGKILAAKLMLLAIRLRCQYETPDLNEEFRRKV